jgi:hypothetical protein
MEKTGTKQKEKKPNKKKQYERFQEAARKLGVDNEESAVSFELSFAKIVPAKRKQRSG